MTKRINTVDLWTEYPTASVSRQQDIEAEMRSRASNGDRTARLWLECE